LFPCKIDSKHFSKKPCILFSLVGNEHLVHYYKVSWAKSSVMNPRRLKAHT
jgi:hypothetical protein